MQKKLIKYSYNNKGGKVIEYKNRFITTKIINSKNKLRAKSYDYKKSNDLEYIKNQKGISE